LVDGKNADVQLRSTRRIGPPIDSTIRESVGSQECRNTFVRIAVKRRIGERVLVPKEHRLVQRDRKDQRQQVLGGKLRIFQRH
jgi:hypothetical protein